MRNRLNKLSQWARLSLPISLGIILAAGILFVIWSSAFALQNDSFADAKEDGYELADSSNLTSTTSIYLPVILRGPDAVDPLTNECHFVEFDETLVIEVESTLPVADWVQETAVPGYTGSGYFTWHGENLFASPGTGVLTYPIYIHHPGNYQVRLHNYHAHPEGASEGNDIWMRLDGTTPWYKTFSIIERAWTWATLWDITETHRPPPFYYLDAGEHILELSARSESFSINRITLFKSISGGGQNLARPESGCYMLPLP